MSDAFLRFWRVRTAREQRMLLAMAALAALVLAWLLIVRPLDGALADARARHARAVIALGQAKGEAEAIARIRRTAPPPPAGPITATVGTAAREAGFADARIEQEGAGTAAVTIDAARPQTLFAWLSAMERRGLLVERFSARANSDATLAARISFRPRR